MVLPAHFAQTLVGRIKVIGGAMPLRQPLLTLLLNTCIVIRLMAAGTVIDEVFHANSLDEDRSVRIYLPQDYDAGNSSIRYPLIIFLHGGYVDQYSYPMLFDALDQVIWPWGGTVPEGRIQPVIAALPDGNAGAYGEMTWWSNSTVNGDFEDYVTSDIVTFIDENFNTIASADHRAVMGHSMGGYGAMSIALRNTSLFRGVSTFGGVIDLDVALTGITPWILDENGGHGPFLPQAGVWTEVLYSMAAAFSPHPGLFPDPVDLPIDANGDRIPEIWALWDQENPTTVAGTLSPEDDLGIYLQCGVADMLWIDVNRAFSDSLDRLGIAHAFSEFEGDHNNALRQRFPYTLLYFDSLFTLAPIPVNTEGTPDRPGSFKLVNAYPNPFNPSTTILYELAESAPVTIAIQDITGSRVKILAAGYQRSGRHEMTWTGENDSGGRLDAGIYFCRLETGGLSDMIKIVLLE